MTVNGPSVYGAHLGESESNLRVIFTKAVASSEKEPTVLFIDEIVCLIWIYFFVISFLCGIVLMIVCAFSCTFVVNVSLN